MKPTKAMQTPRHAKVLIVDDHPLVRLGLKSLLDREADLVTCGEASGPDEALRLADEHSPDLAVVDLSLGNDSGLDLVKRLHVHHPDLCILVCSMHDESLFASRVLKAGARGFINKQEASAHVVQALRRVLAGDIYLSQAMTQELLLSQNGEPRDTIDALSNRELEVFSLIGQGLKTTRIAEQLNLSVKTVESHREKIKQKLKLDSSCELARYAAQWSITNG